MEVEAVLSRDERLEICDTNVEFASRGYWEVREVKTPEIDPNCIPPLSWFSDKDLSNDRGDCTVKELNGSDDNEDVYICHFCNEELPTEMLCQKHIDVCTKRKQWNNKKPNQTKINSVQYLLSNGVIPHDKKISIKQLGRPTPSFRVRSAIVEMGTNNGDFDASIYDKFEWLCGCPVMNRLFCFPCLLFRRTLSPWTDTGIMDTKHLAKQAKSHQSSSDHISAHLDFSVAGRPDVQDQLSVVYLRDKMSHNARVGKNRSVLRRLIASIKYCGELKPSENCDVTNKIDCIIASHLEETEIFKDPLRTVRSELLDAIFVVYRAEIIKQIESADFVALEVNEGTDSQDVRHAILMFRYVVNGRICERFSTFTKPAMGTPEEFSDVLLAELRDILPLPYNSKLIAQCYDGASLLLSMDNDYNISTIIRTTFPHAHCIHSYSHQFNLIAELTVQSHNTVKVFLAHLQSFSRFFVRSPEAVSILCEVMKSTVGHPGPTLWDIEYRTATILFEHKESFVDCLKDIADLNRVGAKTINEAYGLLYHLDNPDFLYWLKIFHLITPHIEVFDQARDGNIKQLQSALEHLKQQIVLTESSIHPSEDLEPPEKRPKTACGNNFKSHGIAKEVCNNILRQIEARFDFKGHLNASKLFDSSKFNSYRYSFPQNHFEATVQSYSMLDSAKLRSELTAMYQRQDLSQLDGILPLLLFLSDNDLKTVLSETYKLVSIICTTPMLTSEGERCFSMLKGIKVFLNGARSDDKLNALAVLSVEKDFVQSIPDFEKKVIDVFTSAKNRTMDFAYR